MLIGVGVLLATRCATCSELSMPPTHATSLRTNQPTNELTCLRTYL